MSFRRELAKALIREVVSDRASRASSSLRRSALREPTGLTKDSLQALAKASDELSENPDPIIQLLESWWDAPRREQRQQGLNW